MQMHYFVTTPLSSMEPLMATLSKDVSTLTDRYQTTVPLGVRKLLKLNKGDKIRYCTEPSGRVYIELMRTDAEDPALGAFLDLIEADIAAHPERIRGFSGALQDRLKALVGDIEIDLDETLSPEDE
jgi:antitoxin PrlF